MCKTNLTVVLTLKGREQYTYRWMQYMDAISFPYKIIIADGGSSRTLQNHLQDNNSYKNIDYEYIRYPIDETIDVYYDKLIDVVSKVKSKYLLMADNDDFFIVDKVEEMLSFMDCNNDYVGIRGGVVNLKIYPFCFFGFGCNGGDSYSAIRNESKSIDDAIAIDRVRSLCKGMSKHDYYMNWYCIYRTDELVDVINNVLKIFANKYNDKFDIRIINENDKYRIRLEKYGQLYYQLDNYYLTDNSLSSVFIDEAIQNRVKLKNYFTLEKKYEIIFRLSEIKETPTKKHHIDYVINNIENADIELIKINNLDDIFNNIMQNK